MEKDIRDCGYTLPPPISPIGNYAMATQVGDLLFVSGHGPGSDRPERGKVGQDVTIEQAYECARSAALSLLGTLKAELGDLGRVKRVVKVFGLVNCVPEFRQHPAVINGASDVFVAAFGEAGKHARSAVGAPSLPNDIPVEIEAILEIG